MENIVGKWIGTYAFDPEFNEENRDSKFEMTLVGDDDEFTGESFDVIEEGKAPIIAKIQGFVDENEISFVKKYPSLVLKNELNESITDETKEHPEINYHGVIMEDRIEGTWDMEVGVVMQAGQYYSQIITGTWKVERFS